MATTPHYPAPASTPSPPNHPRACDSDSELPDVLRPQPKRARCSSPDLDSPQAQSSSDNDRAPQTQLETTCKRSSPRLRSSPHDDALDPQDEEADEDEMVLSEVHIHPENGRVDGRWLTSIFLLSHTNQDRHQETRSDDGSDEDEDQVPDTWDHAVEIQHTMGTTLREVGSQVWMGCFLLVDYIIEMKDQLNQAVVLELGGGTGLASIALGLMTDVSTVYCTDFDSDILSNCAANIIYNGQREVRARDEPEPVPFESRIKARRLNWLMEDPMQPLEDQRDRFDWLETEAEEWRTKGAFIFAADDELDVVAQAHDYFVKRMGRSSLLEAQRIDYSSLGRYCDYDRSKDLEIYRVACRVKH
ncbi:unnamed protein product [Mortierella alpina]